MTSRTPDSPAYKLMRGITQAVTCLACGGVFLTAMLVLVKVL